LEVGPELLVVGSGPLDLVGEAWLGRHDLRQETVVPLGAGDVPLERVHEDAELGGQLLAPGAIPSRRRRSQGGLDLPDGRTQAGAVLTRPFK
jgi:hypothetical protein